MKRSLIPAVALGALAALAGQGASAEKVRIAMIDPGSGPFAAVAANWFKTQQLAVEMVNASKAAGEHTLEVVQFDNKGSTQESLILLRNVADQGFHYVTQGGSSAVGAALIDAVNKHNERNPGKEIVYLDTLNADPELTNAKCSFWHFAFAPNTNMSTEALTTELANNPKVKKVYIIGQNYPFGQAVSRATKELLKRKRADIEVVGDDLHPLGQVKDFSPYIAKINASGADTVVTGNWGPDLTLLLKAGNEAGLRVNFYTYFANTFGVPLALDPSIAGRLKNIAPYSPNNAGFVGKDFVEGFKKRYNEDFILLGNQAAIASLAEGIRRAKSTDPVKVAYAMEGMKLQGLSGEMELRKSDHQMQAPLYVTSWSRLNGKDVKYDQNDTGYGWQVERRIDAYVAAQPTSCAMTRPAQR
ncbi:MAG: branched-chain amino acid ABC transporter substrate-binding protein [Gammaproteobacteria bacterium]|nr:branched-chain amino acid ABC transporter substrate-binding protein [Gammaproteobacteria bacterium]MBU1440229.1 branched-chain amino acid ABC transporter substrate-binding protein [Gammaproteobacteria bacterium]MBU2288045.1 branched-chain amino acid ABC transporter substrate-binding protein [Gammaproteobacteria bacterium]MBU2411139.1 branched-chain amino acid ABC transporter substrate-binding protein [Gammaproteobacteria bacterium]